MSNQSAELAKCEESDRLQNRCRSCGALLLNRKPKYCSDECKSHLQRRLFWAEGLLRALDARFAAVKWDTSVLILQVLSSRGRLAHCFLMNRTACAKPAEDLERMVEELGNQWSDMFRATRSRSQATQNVIRNAKTTVTWEEVSTPVRRKAMSSSATSSKLRRLQLTYEDLLAPDCEKRIKSAFRQQAMSTHPDHGGTADEFRKVKEAADSLAAWLTKTATKGKRVTSLPNAWVYHAGRSRNMWSPPSG